MKRLILLGLLLSTISIQAQIYRFKAVSRDSSDTIVSNIVVVPYVHLPILFTPNGDGFNDMFVPISVGVQNFKVEVFTINGKLVATLRQGDQWAGTGTRQIYKVKASWYDPLRDQYYLTYESVLEGP
jgi:gliding motility-associated-like protein